MKTTNNTVLITGGSAGIGYELAKIMLANGNRVIVTGRDERRLKEATASLMGVVPIKSDVSNEKEMDKLIERIYLEFPDTNILINNAGKALVYPLLGRDANPYENAKEEMQTNYFSAIRLIQRMIPHLKTQASSAIVNVSSVLALVPGRLVTYSASKAALHSYTQALRMLLAEESNIKVFELMPPLVNTELSKDIGGENGVHPSVVAERLLKGLGNDEYEIHVGQTEQIYKLFLSSPEEALKKIFASRKAIK
jgi:uncharacterized oxidoreductase